MSSCKTTFEDGDNDIVIYDSIFSNLNEATKTLLVRMVHTNKKLLSVRMANVTKQSENNDGGLFAIAYTAPVFYTDKTQVWSYTIKQQWGHTL